MSWYIKKSSGLGNAVPTDGATYLCANGRFSNVFDDRKAFSTREEAESAVTIKRPFSPDTLLPNVEFIEE